MTTIEIDAAVIGSGPGGYVAGIRLGQLGIKTVVVEREKPGGVCLNVGCIPSKALIHAAKTFDKLSHSQSMGIAVSAPPTVDMAKMQEWKSGIVAKLNAGVTHLLGAAGTELVTGTAKLAPGTQGRHHVVVRKDGDERTYLAKNVIVATGSRPIEIPGFAIDQKHVIDSTGALGLAKIPQTMVIIGGGYIGLELGTVYAKLGSRVTVVEAMDSLLSGMDADCVAVVARKLRKMGVEVLLNAKAKGWEQKSGHLVVTADVKGQTVSIDSEVVLLSVGRRPNSKDIGLEDVGVNVDARGFIAIDRQLRTNIPGIYAIGDVAGGMMLAHKASKEAEVVAEVIAGHNDEMDSLTIPAVVFTDPEVASTGMTEIEAKQAGHQVKVGKFPFAALGRALSVNDTDGFAKIIGDAETGAILGVHIVGNGAADLISEPALGIEMGATLRDMALTIHPHPTLSESLREAAAAALGEAIHIVNR